MARQVDVRQLQGLTIGIGFELHDGEGLIKEYKYSLHIISALLCYMLSGFNSIEMIIYVNYSNIFQK